MYDVRFSASVLRANRPPVLRAAVPGLVVPAPGPEAAGLFHAENFVDSTKTPGPGITWGLHHVLGDWNYLRRFECDLTTEKGDRINQIYEPYRRLREGERK